jgi:hypothetical protein
MSARLYNCYASSQEFYSQLDYALAVPGPGSAEILKTSSSPRDYRYPALGNYQLITQPDKVQTSSKTL